MLYIQDIHPMNTIKNTVGIHFIKSGEWCQPGKNCSGVFPQTAVRARSLVFNEWIRLELLYYWLPHPWCPYYIGILTNDSLDREIRGILSNNFVLFSLQVHCGRPIDICSITFTVLPGQTYHHRIVADLVIDVTLSLILQPMVLSLGFDRQRSRNTRLSQSMSH